MPDDPAEGSAVRNSEALYRTTFDEAATAISHAAVDGTWLRAAA